MQQLIMDTNPHRFQKEVNALMMDGWKVVPGTMYGVSLPKVAGINVPERFIIEGLTFIQVYSVVLENEEAR